MYFLKFDTPEGKLCFLEEKRGFHFKERQNHLQDYLGLAVTSKQNRLQGCKKSQIAACEKPFANLMYLLKIDSPEMKICGF